MRPDTGVLGIGRNTKQKRLLHAGISPASGLDSSQSKFFAGYTCLGLVGAKPHEVWDMISEPSKTWASWLSSVSSVQELDSRPLSEDTQEYEVIQKAIMSLCGYSMQADMHLVVHSNSSNKQVTFTLKKKNKLMRSIQGRFQVWSLGDGDIIKEQLGHLNADELHDLLERHGVEDHQLQDVSVVLLEQTVNPYMSPPPGFRGMLKRHLGNHFESMIADLQNAPFAMSS